MSGRPIGEFPDLIRADALVKLASARANVEIGSLDPEVARHIEAAALELADGVRSAFGVCRRRAATLAMIGMIVFAPLAVLEALAVGLIQDPASGTFGHRTLALSAYLGISLLMLGSALCAGLLDTVVGHEFGEQDLGWRRAIRTLPYRRLIGVDVSQALIIGSLSVLGFVPGLIAFTLTCLAGSLVMIEDRGVRSALGRSLALTRRRVGLTLLVVTLPVAVEHQVIHALTASISMSFATAWIVHAVAAVVFLVPVVVVEITLAHHLRRDEDAATRYACDR